MSLGKRIGIGTTQPEGFLHVVSDVGTSTPTMISSRVRKPYWELPV